MVTAPMNPAPASAAALPLEGRSTDRRAISVVFLYFVIAGVETVMLGPALPTLSARWNLPDARLGTLFFAFFAGQFCGSWVATPKLRASLIFGAFGSALGLVVLAHAGAATAYFALFCAGLGLGAGLTAGNVIVGACAPGIDHAPDGRGSSRTRLLTLLNICWGIGAIACPLLLEASLRLRLFHAEPGQLFFLGLAMAFAVCAALAQWLLPREPSTRAAAFPSETLEGRTQIPRRIIFFFGGALVLCVGVENCLGGWLPSYAVRLSPGGSLAGRASAIALCFWICELAGRGLTALLIRSVNERLFYRACLLVLIATSATLALRAHLSVVAVFAGTAVAAISLAPLFPL